MAIKKELTTEAQILAHTISFSGYDLARGGGNLTIADRWVDGEGNPVSAETVETLSILTLRQNEAIAPIVREVDILMRKLCEAIWVERYAEKEVEDEKANLDEIH